VVLEAGSPPAQAPPEPLGQAPVQIVPPRSLRPRPVQDLKDTVFPLHHREVQGAPPEVQHPESALGTHGQGGGVGSLTMRISSNPAFRAARARAPRSGKPKWAGTASTPERTKLPREASASSRTRERRGPRRSPPRRRGRRFGPPSRCPVCASHPTGSVRRGQGDAGRLLPPPGRAPPGRRRRESSSAPTGWATPRRAAGGAVGGQGVPSSQIDADDRFLQVATLLMPFRTSW
jgi:hypothetical protein